ncbi:CDP-glucose 4,6-dehydratase [Limnofasciculus baicalensis]|uniref:CDP-glucose 4,6-dehydratase n=1 Tax=Limnofasciculus baicalensis BBK-W-15 TaxID=2699891 RepID=A0AAE3GT75_9CYAN|nr:CDP-glucose 4,6-dehydratase [Limnofasciculus baicalensis]MCP2730226.1 CDP-glucose 4,6-dehydratase [Limnofasciculus baicalensis BBK-W-15]
MDYTFWNGKKVLITGHTGFKGSWLSIWLQSLGAITIGYALSAPTEPSLFELANVERGMVSLVGDIRDLENLKAVMAQHQPEIVFHMAAQPLVRYSYRHPVETYTTNIIGTVNILEAVRHTPSVRTIVTITSDKCYQNKEWVWGYRESETLGGRDPYSSSKACAEIVISAYRDSYFSAADYNRHRVALASARAGNVIGGGDWAVDRLIPDIMRSFMMGRSVLIRNPHATRPWQHVLQPLSGYLCVAEYLWKYGLKYAEAWNFGPNEEDAKPVVWIVEQLTKLWGNGATWELDGGHHPHEENYLKLDCSKAKNRLGWKPALSLEQTLEWIVDFYQSYLNKRNIRELVEDQINRYQSLEQKTILSRSLITQPPALSAN